MDVEHTPTLLSVILGISLMKSLENRHHGRPSQSTIRPMETVQTAPCYSLIRKAASPIGPISYPKLPRVFPRKIYRESMIDNLFGARMITRTPSRETLKLLLSQDDIIDGSG